jgi:hypothetical protein
VTSRRQKVVLLGMMSKIPVAGVVWQTVHYLVGLERLGFETYYVEAHARTPSMFMRHEADDGSRKAAAFIDGVCRRFGLHDRWAFHALHDDNRCFGMTGRALRELYHSAELIINLHAGTVPLPEYSQTGRLILLGATMTAGCVSGIPCLRPRWLPRSRRNAPGRPGRSRAR